jgi:hypothetical protein
MSSIDDNVKNLMESIDSLNEAISGIGGIDVESMFMPDEEIMIKMMVNSFGMEEEVAYKTVFGELQYDNNGKLKYPGVVNYKKTILDKKNSFKKEIQKMKKEFKMSMNKLKVSSIEVVEASAQLNIEIISGVVAITSSMSIFPPGSGVPTAFSAVQSIFSNLSAYQTKVNQIMPYLDKLPFVNILMPVNIILSIEPIINSTLKVMTTSIKTALSVIIMITAFKNKLSPPPGVGGTPPDELKVKVRSSDRKISKGEDVELTSEVTGGKWDYSYLWTSDNSQWSSTGKSIVVKPLTKTKYKLTVIDKETGASASDSVTIKVN